MPMEHLPAGIVDRFAAHIEQTTGRAADTFAAAAAGPGIGAVKVLVLHDEDDEIVPYLEGEAIAAAWPGAVLHGTRGLGHNRMLRDAGVIRTAVAFLA